MRKYILQYYTTLADDTRLVGHHGLVHLRNFFMTVGGLIFVWVTYIIIQGWLGDYLLMTYITGALIGILYLRFVIEFLNKHLDALIISSQGIAIFDWEEVLRYKFQQFDRQAIDMISHKQSTFMERIFGSGSLYITINQGISFTLYDIPHVKRVAQLLREYKHQYHTGSGLSDHIPEDSHDKFEILVETLGEVIKDYMDRPQSSLPHKPRER